MNSLISKTKDYLNRFLEVGVLLLAVSIIAEILFGQNVPFFGLERRCRCSFLMPKRAITFPPSFLSAKRDPLDLKMSPKGPKSEPQGPKSEPQGSQNDPQSIKNAPQNHGKNEANAKIQSFMFGDDRRCVLNHMTVCMHAFRSMHICFYLYIYIDCICWHVCGLCIETLVAGFVCKCMLTDVFANQ